MIALSASGTRLLRLDAQQLLARASDTVSDTAALVKRLCGIQAQDTLAAKLAVRVRSTVLKIDDIERALVQERSIVRTWGPRGTLHFLAAEDIGWLLPLLGPIFIAASRRRYNELGLDEAISARGLHIIKDTLAAHGPLTRAEIVEQLATHGLRIEGQARPYLISRAALEGFICYGPDRGAEPTYVLISDWIHETYSLPEKEAIVELALRYLRAYGPATPEDFAAWSGIAMNTVRTAWQHMMDQLAGVEIAGEPAWLLQADLARLEDLARVNTPAPIVRLLPGFDNYLLGYKNRDFAVPSLYTKRINAGGGMVRPTLLVDGRIEGTWKMKRHKNYLDIEIEPFDRLVPEVLPALQAEVVDIGRFLGVMATLRILPSS